MVIRYKIDTLRFLQNIIFAICRKNQNKQQKAIYKSTNLQLQGGKP